MVAGLIVPGLGQRGHAEDGGVLGQLQFPGPFGHQIAQMITHVLEREVGGHPGLDNGRGKGLDDVINRSQQQTFFLAICLVQGGDKDDGDFSGLGILLELNKDLIAVHLRHHDVQEDQVRTGLGLS